MFHFTGTFESSYKILLDVLKILANFAIIFHSIISSVIRQKGQSQNGCYKKKSMPNFLKNEYYLLPDKHTYVCLSGGKKCLFFGKFPVSCFLVMPVLRLALLPYYRQYLVESIINQLK